MLNPRLRGSPDGTGRSGAPNASKLGNSAGRGAGSLQAVLARRNQAQPYKGWDLGWNAPAREAPRAKRTCLPRIAPPRTKLARQASPLSLERAMPSPSKAYPPAKSRRSGARGGGVADRLVSLQILKEGFRYPLMALDVPMPIESETSILDPVSLAEDVIV